MAERTLDTRISLGNLLTILTVLLAVGASWVSLNASVARMEQRQADFDARVLRIESDHDTVTRLASELQALTKKLP